MHKKLRYQLTLFQDIDDKRTIQTDCMKGKHGYIQPTKLLVSQMLPLLEDWFHKKKLRYHLILSRDIDDQRTLQFN